MSMSMQPFIKPIVGFSWGRLLGSWVGMALMPLFPMLNWIFAPYFSLEKMMAHGMTIATFQQYQAAVNQLGAAELLGRILPLLLLCLGLSVAFSWAFGRAGRWIEHCLRKRLFSNF